MTIESDVLDFVGMVPEGVVGATSEASAPALGPNDDLIGGDLYRMIADLQADVRARDATISVLAKVQQQSLMRLALAAEYKDGETGTHIVRIGAFSALLARECGMDREYCRKIAFAAPMHDVGKVGIADSILRKPGALTDDERHIMKRHCEIGRRILAGSGVPLLELAAEVAFTHHEKFDGTGYPSKLAGESIPLSGRLVALVDVFDALTMDRPFRAAMTVEEAVQIVRAASGTHFDPFLVDAFLNVLDQILDLREKVNEAKIDLTGLSELIAA